MVQNQWNDAEYQGVLGRYAENGPDLAERIYSSRLIGRDDSLVMHGGGNTSVKSVRTDALGREFAAIAVKGSGHDLADIGPAGLPWLALEPMQQLLALDTMTDAAMVNEVRRQLVDVAAPNPSVEAILHAALPHKFVDHTHADAILVLTNQPNGSELVRECFGDRVAIVPWIMPGFPLAKAVSQAYADNPGVAGVVLVQHGLFTFGDSARQSYDRMIELVATAESFAAARIQGETMTSVGVSPAGHDVAGYDTMVQHLRGAVAAAAGERLFHRMIGTLRAADDIRAFSAHPDCAALLAAGPLTPNHLIRTKAWYLFVTPEQAADKAAARAAVAEYAARYTAWFEANRARMRVPPTMLDPYPRVVVIAGVGIVAFGNDHREAEIAADVAEHTLRAKARAQAIGGFVALSDAELFEMEYWPLERRKVDERRRLPLEGQVAVVTGGAGGIGFGICASLVTAGAAVAVTDISAQGVETAVAKLRAIHPRAALLGVVMDVTDPDSVAAGFGAITTAFGGVDIVVPNAGIAHVSSLADMKIEDFQRVLDVNLTGTLTILKAACNAFAAQDTAGAVIVQASKNVFSPGASFGAYSASKAGQHQLGKIAALELAPLGVRVNMVNADAVFGDAVPSGLWAEVGPDRMKSRGLDEQGLRDYYRDRSLLKVTVTPKHVGDAVVFLASDAAGATTGMTFTVDGGVAAAFPR